MQIKNRKEITTLVEHYFDGLYHADAEALLPLFHRDARYVNTVKDDYMNYSIAEYLSIVNDRTSPASQGHQRDDRIIKIEFDDHRMAIVQLTMTMLGRRYLDYLTLILSENGWQIISKVFSYKTEQGT